MMHIINKHLAPESRPLLQATFADRKPLSGDLRDWDVPAVDGTYQINPSEKAHAVYLVAADEERGHTASIRLYAHNRPNLGNIGGWWPSALLGDQSADHLPAIEALRPNRVEPTALFVRTQLGEFGWGAAR